MLALINTNRMAPPIAPIGLDYVAGAARAAGIETRVIDLCLADDAAAALREGLDADVRLVGMTFRNVDDCFWPSATSFVPALADDVAAARRSTDAPVVLGGVGLSILPERVLEASGADFAVRGDGEIAVVSLYRALQAGGDLADVPGLVSAGGEARPPNAPAWQDGLSLATRRDAIDNAAYFARGGQGGVETKRGCDRRCIYCADPLAKGPRVRPRDPVETADEVEALLSQGVDVLHVCDGEFNIPPDHAKAVCRAWIDRGLGERIRWYTYCAVTPFDAELADLMRRAGCAGIDFTGDAGCDALLAAYGHPHDREALGEAVRLCRARGITSMVDLLLGGPGETSETVAETIDFLKRIGPDCVGAGVGVRLYPETDVVRRLRRRGPLESLTGLRRRYEGPVDLLQPTFYISPELGDRPSALVRERIAGDERFFPPAPDPGDRHDGCDHNYNDNAVLVDAIAAGARGAYWDILRRMKS